MVQVGALVARAVGIHSAEVIAVTRRVGVYVDGLWVVDGGATEVLEVRGSVSPAGPKALERLPEGQRTKGVLRVLTESELKTRGESGAMADLLSYGGVGYEVESVADWNGYFDVLAVRLEETA